MYVLNEEHGWLPIETTPSIDVKTLNESKTMRCAALVDTKSAALFCLSLANASMVPYESCIGFLTTEQACYTLQVNVKALRCKGDADCNVQASLTPTHAPRTFRPVFAMNTYGG